MSGYGIDTPFTGHGTPPYHESALRAAMRLMGRNLGSGLQGLSQVPQGANFGSAFLAAAGGSARASSAAYQAAQEYAMKQQQDEERSKHQALIDKKLQTEAETPPKEPPPPKPTKDAEASRILGRELTEDEKKKLAGVYIAPKMPAKGKAAPKTPQARAQDQISVAKIKRLEKEAQGLQETNDPNDLLRASNDMKWLPETRRAAWAKFQRLSHPDNAAQVP